MGRRPHTRRGSIAVTSGRANFLSTIPPKTASLEAARSTPSAQRLRHLLGYGQCLGMGRRLVPYRFLARVDIARPEGPRYRSKQSDEADHSSVMHPIAT